MFCYVLLVREKIRFKSDVEHYCVFQPRFKTGL